MPRLGKITLFFQKTYYCNDCNSSGKVSQVNRHLSCMIEIQQLNGRTNKFVILDKPSRNLFGSVIENVEESANMMRLQSEALEHVMDKIFAVSSSNHISKLFLLQ